MGLAPVSYYYLSPEPETAPAQSPEGALLRVALALNQGSSAGEIVRLIFESLGNLVPYDRIGLALLDPDGWLLSRVVISRYPIILGEGYRGRLSGSSLEPIIRRQQIRVINDLEAYLREHPASKSTAQLVAEGMRSSLTLPLISKRKAIGVMFFTSIQREAYGSEHIALLRTLATNVAIALERAELTSALSHALAELKTLDQLKTNFLSNLSHELRTPLCIVLSYLQSLDDEVAGALSPPQHALLSEAIGAAERLNLLFNDLFDFTELSSGVLHLDCVPIDLIPLLRELGEEARPTLEQAGLTLALVLPEGPLAVKADPPRLAKAVRNLLDNARKFTPSPGQVTLRAGRGPAGIWLEVSDTGIGIPPEDQRRVFERFVQLDAGPNRPHGGAGLGLALTRAIVEAHGGSISLRSAPGQGSAFRITLPPA